MEKINEEAEERFNKWLERTPNGRVAMAYDAWMEQQKIIDSLQAECLKYREALRLAYIENQNLNCQNLPSKMAQKALHDQTVILREALKKEG
jgi:hypothetical protein